VLISRLKNKKERNLWALQHVDRNIQTDKEEKDQKNGTEYPRTVDNSKRCNMYVIRKRKNEYMRYYGYKD
jgi:hypothetical protein